jgi:hypothetical protein
MERYINFGGDPDVSAFEILNDAIRIELSNGDIFVYSNQGAGEYNIQQMKSIAIRGGPLNHFILRNVVGLHDMKVSHFQRKKLATNNQTI